MLWEGKVAAVPNLKTIQSRMAECIKNQTNIVCPIIPQPHGSRLFKTKLCPNLYLRPFGGTRPRLSAGASTPEFWPVFQACHFSFMHMNPRDRQQDYVLLQRSRLQADGEFSQSDISSNTVRLRAQQYIRVVYRKWIFGTSEYQRSFKLIQRNMQQHVERRLLCWRWSKIPYDIPSYHQPLHRRIQQYCK